MIEDPVRKEIKNRIKAYEDNCMGLAMLLNQVKVQELYTLWGFSSFEDFVDRDLGFSIRRAYYHLKIWSTFGETYKIPEDRIRQIGWMKAGHLAELETAKVLTDDNVQDWVERATEITTKELVAEIKAAKKTASDSPDGSVIDIQPPEGPSTIESIEKVTFHLYAGQKDNVKKAFEVASAMSGSDKKGHLLDTICLSFLASEVTALSESAEAKAWFLRKVEELLQVKVVAFSNGGDLKKNLRSALDGLEDV